MCASYDVSSSGIFHGTADETLEQAQNNKLQLICTKLDLHEGDKMLDIGCGWGTLARFAVRVMIRSVHLYIVVVVGWRIFFVYMYHFTDFQPYTCFMFPNINMCLIEF